MTTVDAPAAPATSTTSSKRPFLYQVGIEFTMMPPVCSGAKTTERSDGEIAGWYAQILEVVLQRKRVKVHGCDRDGRAIEAPTLPLSNMAEAEKAYKDICGSMLSIGLVPAVQGIISGGNHMHWGPLPVRTMVNLFRHAQNSPWLAWVFNDPDDGLTAKTFTEALPEIDADMRANAVKLAAAGIDIAKFVDSESLTIEAQNALTFYGDSAKFKPSWLPDDKGHMLRYCPEHETLEMRFFDVPITWDECEAQLMFADAYIRWIEHAYKTNMCQVHIDTPEKLKAITQEQAAKAFRDFCGLIGVPAERYEVWLTENLPVRFERGNLT